MSVYNYFLFSCVNAKYDTVILSLMICIPYVVLLTTWKLNLEILKSIREEGKRVPPFGLHMRQRFSKLTINTFPTTSRNCRLTKSSLNYHEPEKSACVSSVTNFVPGHTWANRDLPLGRD